MAKRESVPPASSGHARPPKELTQKSVCVRFERSIHVPEDEICFFVFEAPSGREAALVADRAGLDPFRVVEAVTSDVDSIDPKEEI